MKSVCMQTWEIKALQENRKTAYRYVLKPQPEFLYEKELVDLDGKLGFFTRSVEHVGRFIKPKYLPRDVLYVREPGCVLEDLDVIYKADVIYSGELVGKDSKYRWKSSILMPKESARFFLRVKKVYAERLSDIKDGWRFDEEGVEYEHGMFSEIWRDFYKYWDRKWARPRPVKLGGIIDHYESYPYMDNIAPESSYKGYRHIAYGNPYVCVVEFEQISKDEAMKGVD